MYLPFSLHLKKAAASVAHSFRRGRLRSSLKVCLLLEFQKPKPNGKLWEFTNINRVALKKHGGKMILPRLRKFPGKGSKATSIIFLSTLVPGDPWQQLITPGRVACVAGVAHGHRQP